MDTITLALLFSTFLLLIFCGYFCVAFVRRQIRLRQLETRLNVLGKNRHSTSSVSTSPLQLWRVSAGPVLSKAQWTLLIIGLTLPVLLIITLLGFSNVALLLCGVFYFLVVGISVLVFRIRRRKRLNRFIADLPNAIELIVRGIRSGRTITGAMQIIGRESKGPLAEEFMHISEQIELGKDFISVVADAAYRLKIPEFSFFSVVLSVQQETGGNIVKTLMSLAEMLRQHQILRMKIKALSSEGLYSAYFLGALPFIIAGILAILQPAYIGLLFTDGVGRLLLLGAFISQGIGCLVIAKMIRIDI